MSAFSSSRRAGAFSVIALAAMTFFISLPALLAQTQSDDSAVYHAPEGTAPPVAPPLRKGSALDHLTNDPKQAAPVPGYREGRTSGPAEWVGHRFVDPQGGTGWGWVRKSGDGWGSAKWIALQETLGVAVAPFRKLVHHEDDSDYEFKFWGSYAPYKAYDPHLDEQLPVFVLQGYEVIGPAATLNLRIGAPGRPQSRGSGASSRSSSPILSNPGVD